MDERDVFISRIRKELEDKENENRMLAAKLKLMRLDIDGMETALKETREKLTEAQDNYHEMRNRYTELMGNIMQLMARLKEQ